jgi:hypothetical protein
MDTAAAEYQKNLAWTQQLKHTPEKPGMESEAEEYH